MRQSIILNALVLGILSIPALGAVSKVSDFSLKATDGKDYGLASALKSNKAAVVVFIATKCPYSNAYNERYSVLADKLKSKQVAFLAINANAAESLNDVKGHAAEHKFSFPVLKDDGNKVADVFKAEKTPEVFLVGKDLSVLYHGRIDDDGEGKNASRKEDLMVAVDEVLAAKKVAVPETKAFGCSIKRKG